MSSGSELVKTQSHPRGSSRACRNRLSATRRTENQAPTAGQPLDSQGRTKLHNPQEAQSHFRRWGIQQSTFFQDIRVILAEAAKLKMAAFARTLNLMYRMAIPASAGAFLITQSIYDVKGGTRAVIFDRLSGVKEDVVNEGTHFLIPWLQRSVIFDVRTKPRNIATTTGSKDLQMVSLTLRVLHRPDVKALPKIYQVSILLVLYDNIYTHSQN